MGTAYDSEKVKFESFSFLSFNWIKPNWISWFATGATTPFFLLRFSFFDFVLHVSLFSLHHHRGEGFFVLTLNEVSNFLLSLNTLRISLFFSFYCFNFQFRIINYSYFFRRCSRQSTNYRRWRITLVQKA